MTLSSQVVCSMLTKSERAHSSTLTPTTCGRVVSYWPEDWVMLAYWYSNDDTDGDSGSHGQGSLAIVV